MPYIPPQDREHLDDVIADLGSHELTPGELNYVITRILLRNLPDPRYEDYALATGVLETVKLELYRRAVVPYEDAKLRINGDVY